ncbi:hypothetical protein B5M47_03685 [candidate division CPR3 bacterium 4484_211]|uniref:Transcription elongation factor GreA n=1 Tax=candidate division CPR3 bacterium 4484_211 TaxID=1968527 RepID=A0A1W9NX62_UNCC3|nr:MAG: hypothetical protein B5M47_03685 [candidate division CPR3 bacterium 4484_211]
MTNQKNTKNLITKEGLEEFKKEYDELVSSKRPRVLKRVSEMRSLGDLKENEAYHAARKQLAFIDGRIKELEYIFKNALVSNKNKGSTAQIGSSIKLEVEGQQQKITLVGESEGNLSQGRISVSSPLGRAILGKSPGTEIKVEAPGGEIIYKILEIN